MPIEPDLIELMLDEVTLEPWTGKDRYANPVFGSPRTAKCRIEHNTRRIISVEGHEKVSSAQVTLADPTLPISTKDRLTLPDGSQPAILKIAAAKDEVGPYYLQVFA